MPQITIFANANCGLEPREIKSCAFGNRATQFSADGFGGEAVDFLVPGDRLNLAGWVAPNRVGGTFPFQPTPVLDQV
jgi:hypothetical protein